MIWESYYWKNDLLKQAQSLRKRKQQHRWPEASFARVNQTVMLGFYSIRKLIEAAKLSNATIDQQLQLATYPWRGNKPVHKMNWDKIDELYDLTSSSHETHDLLFICHQIVHSFVFTFSFYDKDGGLAGLLFTSDRHRHQRLYGLGIDHVIDLFEQVGKDYPNEVKGRFNPDTQDWDFDSVMNSGDDWA